MSVAAPAPGMVLYRLYHIVAYGCPSVVLQSQLTPSGTSAFELEDLAVDVDVSDAAAVWEWVDRIKPDLRPGIEDAIQSHTPLFFPTPLIPVQLGRGVSSEILPPYDDRSLTVDPLWAFRHPMSETRRYSRLPPRESPSTLIDVTLVLGVFMNIGRLRYDQVPFDELRKQSAIQTKFRECTAVLDFAADNHDTEFATIRRELCALLDGGSEAPVSPGSSPLSGLDDDVDEGPTALSDLDDIRVLEALLTGVRQVSFTIMHVRYCLSKSCRAYATPQIVQRTTPFLPHWCSERRRHVRGLGQLLDWSFRPSPSARRGAEKPCPGCDAGLRSIWAIVDRPPLRLVFGKDFLPAELASDEFRDIFFEYMTPSTEWLTAHYRWYAVLYRHPKRGYKLIINQGVGTINEFEPDNQNRHRIRIVPHYGGQFKRNGPVVARVYQLQLSQSGHQQSSI